MAAAKEDRLRLMQSCHANLSPVFGIYPGPLLQVDRLFVKEEKSEPTADLRDWDGIRHRVWTFEDPAGIDTIRRAFGSVPIFIADGHHRYETALAFRDLVRARDRGDPTLEKTRPYNYIMMTLVSADDPGLVILPIHRLLRHLPGGELDAYLTQVSRQFAVERMPFPVDPDAGAKAIVGRLRVTGSGMHRFGLYAGGEKAYVLTLTDERIVEAEVTEGKVAAYKRLDVTILHALLIDGPLRRQGQGTLPDDSFIYTHDAVEAIRMVQQGKWGAAFFLNPTRIAEVQAVASAGLRMPPKSTFFYPKLLTGLVIHPLLLDEVVEA
jgi:uncharacterized protein (DUF1015 family)